MHIDVLGSWYNFGTPGVTPSDPRGSLRGPEWVSEESNDVRHVVYQLHLVFCTENESRFNTTLKFLFRLPQGDPWASRGPPGFEGSQKKLMI